MATAAVGALHAPFARPLLMRLGGCPMAGASKMTAVELERARHIGAEARGTEAAPARPALGFTLDTSTLADVRAWATRTHADCDDPHPGLVVCKDVAPQSLGRDPAEGTIDQLALGFDTHARLVNESTLRQHLAADTASRTARGIVASLESQLGPADRRAGRFDAKALAQPGAAGISTVMYRFSDYIADVSTTNLGVTGPMLREHYMSARD
ncbi:MAG TPA: hypothetical protein VH044_20145 [Polyangiaceae bacterium]|jgi:hypothetical protein|nr:hypothetical protein [Polyangiaceae bacterium]